MGVRKALGVAAWLVLGIQTKETNLTKTVQAKNQVVKKVVSKPGRFTNPLLRIIQPVQPKIDETVVQSEKGQHQIQAPRVAVAEPLKLEVEKVGDLKLEVKDLSQINGSPRAVIPQPIALEDVIKNEALTNKVALGNAEEVDLGPEPVVKKIENVADIPKKPNDLKIGIIPEADATKVEIKSEKPLFEPKAEEKIEPKEKEEPPKTIDIQQTLSNLFKEGMEEDITSLDTLIASLPNVTMDEILTEIKDVESILAEYVQAS
jgi:hypothetical protein